MVGISDLRGMSLPETLSRIVEALEEIQIGDQIDFIIEKEAGKDKLDKIISHLSEFADCEIGEKEEFTLLTVRKRAEVEVKEEGEFVIDENTNVGKLIEKYPRAIDVLASYGFTPLKNPVLRKTLAKTITLGRAKRLKGLSDTEFLEMLEKLRSLER
jgi:TusA-related sulfurtransferase